MTEATIANSYRRPPSPGNPQETTAWALTEMAIRLNDARRAEQDTMLDVVRLNWRLWTIIQAEVLDPQCMVPEPIRGNLIALAAFVDKHTLEMLSTPEVGKLDVLINIDRQLAMGLHENAKVGAPAAEEPAAASPSSVSISA